MVSKRNLMRANRRNFIKALLGLGASATAASLFTKDALAAIDYDPETEVPRIHGYERVNKQAIRDEGSPPEYEPIYEAISREKWVQVEAAHDARRHVEEQLSDLNPEPRVAVGWKTKRGKPERAVIVEHEIQRTRNGINKRHPDIAFDKFSDLIKDRFPEDITGTAGRGTDAETQVESIPLQIERVQGAELQTYYDHEYRTNGVPAGALIHNGTSKGGATVGPYMFDSNYGEWIFVTAAHVSNDSPNGKIYQNDPTGNDYFADVNGGKTKKDGSFDASVLHNLQFGGAWNFAADSANTYQGPMIDGVQSKTGLKDMEFNGTIYKQGIETGRSSGTVHNVGDDGFRNDCNEANGDSGGPYWVEQSSGKTLVSGIHYKGTNGGFAYGTIMERIVNEFNLSTL